MRSTLPQGRAKREESLGLLKSMVGTSFDPYVVDRFVEHVEEFDRLIGSEDIQEQVASDTPALDTETKTKPDAGLASDILGTTDVERQDFVQSVRHSGKSSLCMR
jgi:hypothetical protein